ncbi:type II secretion system protein N [Desulfofustis glycolicus]|uniref:Type IV pilus biogenesis n=1 Tax=Desulfofustis glycolicus DSM 9705 TaxID=1121409 RepID=A0A1M5XF31_9BACT|nr:type II secretion system protein N [Desulfofustis glycolicus]SHH98359.1 Type IV pilus biogenesis [Desulfofustis glycolicus DSM 9705]
MNKPTATKTSFIIPISTLLIITLLCIGAVEGFYYLLDTSIRPKEHLTVEQPAPEQPTPQSQPPTGPTTTELEQTPIDPDISVITSRNLFGSRVGDGPNPQQQDPLEGMELSSLDVVLMGTVTAGIEEDQRAIIYDKTNGRQDLYQQGDYIQQAAVKDIMRGKVILNIDGRDEMLDISQARQVNVPPPEPPVMPVTTIEEVIGRPVGSEPAAVEQPPQPQVVKPTTGSRVIIPRKGSTQLLRPIRK